MSTLKCVMLLSEISGHLPEDFHVLLSDSLSDGRRFLQRLETEWRSGVNRFSHPGERLLVASEQGRSIGIGGITLDPYVNEESAGRIRHVYVHTAFRRNGIGSAILRNLAGGAVQNFKTLTLRTDDADADLFYRALGFSRVKEHPLVTHCLTLTSRSPVAPPVRTS